MRYSCPVFMTNNAECRSARYLREILLGLLPLLLGIQFLGWISFFPAALRGHADFRQLYAAGYMVRTGHARELYDYHAQKAVQDALVGADERALPFIRPAYTALMFVPFSLLSYRAAYLTFLGVNVVLLALAFWLLRSWMNNLARLWEGLPISIFLVFYPAELSLLQGQDSLFLLLLLAGALVALDRGHELAAGALAALGIFKLQIVLPIALLFLLWRRWRFSAGFALSAGLVAAISVLTTGLAQTSFFLGALLSVGGVAGNQVIFPLRVSIMANLRGLIYGLAHSRLSASGMLILTVVASVAILLAAALIPRTQRPEAQFTLAITLSVMVSYYLFIHDLSILLIPIVLRLDRVWANEQAPDPLSIAIAWMAALLLVAPMCIFVMPDHFYLLSLPIFTFMLMLIWNSRHEPSLADTAPP